MVGDILGGIGQNPVRAHQHLILRMLLRFRSILSPSRLLQNPAARKLALRPLYKYICLSQQCERGCPEAFLQDAALPHQQIIADSKTLHLGHMLPHNPFSGKAAQPGYIAPALFQRMEDVRPFVYGLGMNCVFFVHRSINIPAIIPEADMISL
ncbi:hypothetical protein D3C73_944830 [compost metagenome]